MVSKSLTFVFTSLSVCTSLTILRSRSSEEIGSSLEPNSLLIAAATGCLHLRALSSSARLESSYLSPPVTDSSRDGDSTSPCSPRLFLIHPPLSECNAMENGRCQPRLAVPEVNAQLALRIRLCSTCSTEPGRAAGFAHCLYLEPTFAVLSGQF